MTPAIEALVAGTGYGEKALPSLCPIPLVTVARGAVPLSSSAEMGSGHVLWFCALKSSWSPSVPLKHLCRNIYTLGSVLLTGSKTGELNKPTVLASSRAFDVD